MVQWAQDVTGLIGRTPLVELKRFGAEEGGTVATMLAKLEMFSPGGSSKDRVAYQMVCEAEARLLSQQVAIWEFRWPVSRLRVVINVFLLCLIR